MSAALAVVAGATSALSFTFWALFYRDAPVTVGNMRGTALTVLCLAVPLLIASMVSAGRGSLRGHLVWLGCLTYLGYNAVLFCFSVHFNSLFLLFTTMLGLSFWALVTLVRAIDVHRVRVSMQDVPVRSLAAYLLACCVLFAVLWLQAIVPATLANAMPQALDDVGLAQNPVWVLDFAFTFPLTVASSVWLWRRLAWGVIVGGTMTIMLTIETAGIAIDQTFGRLHDPSASMDAVPVLIGLTLAGVFFSALLLRGLDESVNVDRTR